LTLAINGVAGAFIVYVFPIEQPLASVTVNVYCPGAKLFWQELVPGIDHE
jgi:hypothetical protein